MNKLQLLKIFILIMLASCSKSKDKEVTTNNPQQIEVLEYKTNIPLASVQIDLYRCSNYDNEFGCQGKQIFATGITDNNGKYTFKAGELNKATEGIILHKASYWNTNGGTGKVYMSPEAWINIHLTRQNNYPDTSLFHIMVAGEAGIGELTSFNLPVDSIVKVRAVGNEANTLSWQVITKDSHCYQYCIVVVHDRYD